ncbi:MAG TPA: hypothetical protein VGK67_36795 [Myxococcales bacterium]|jgi:hypothetical protein
MSSMQMSATSQPGPALNRWPLAVPGLYLLGACALGAVASSLASGAYTAVLMSAAERAPLGSMDGYVSWALRLFNYGIGLAQLAAVVLLWRSNAPVRSLAGAALGMSAADFGLGLVSDLGWSFLFDGGAGVRAVLQALGWMGVLTAVVAEALTFETVLKLRREGCGGAPGPDGTLRTIFWVGWGPRLALWVLSLAGVRHLLPPWPMFGVRMVLSLVIAAACLAAVRAAIPVAEAAPASPAGGAPPPQLAASPAGGAAGLRNLGLGVLWMLIGGGVTAITYASASSTGGRYRVAYGAIVVGLVQALVGVVQLLRGR